MPQGFRKPPLQGAAVPHQVVRRDPTAAKDGKTQVAFCADVPSLGYATYYVTEDAAAPAAAAPFQIDAEQHRFENDFYRLVLDATTGGIKSLYDKRGQQELVRQDSKYACNALLALEDDDVDIRTHFTGKQWLMREHASTITVAENGPVRLVVEVTGRFMDSSTRRQEIILYRDLARVDLVTTLAWEGKKNIQLYQVFPLNVPDPVVKYAIPYGWQEYGKELKYAAPWPYGPVSDYHWRGMRGWVEAAAAGQGSVTLASECNWAAFSDVGPLPEPGYLFQPMLLRTVRSCGDGNLYYTQQGEHSFRFALQSQADSARLGEEHNSPLLSYVVEVGASVSGALPEQLSFARVEPDHVQLAVAKMAEDGQGIILRLVETRGGPGKTAAEVQLFRPIKKAVKTNIIEENEEDMAAQKDRVSLHVGPLGIETLRLGF